MLFTRTKTAVALEQSAFLFAAAGAFMLAAAGAAGCFFAACAADERSEVVWSGSLLSLPEYTGASMVSETQALFSFSEPVAATSVSVVSSEEGGFEAEASAGAEEYSSDVLVNLSSPPSAGKKFVIAMTVATAHGNTLSLSETLTGYNSRVPDLRINEARIVYGGKSKNVEFIEFEAVSSGNLAGVIIETYGYKSKSEKNTAYTFPSAEVKKGDLVVLHYRLLPEGADFTDETGNGLAVSTGDGASDSARDLWFDAGGKPFSDACVFLLRERSGGSLMDALVYYTEGKDTWLSSMESAVDEAIGDGVWSGSGEFPAFAFDVSGTTATRTICREPNAAVASPKSWYICARSSASPGAENSTKRYEGK